MNRDLVENQEGIPMGVLRGGRRVLPIGVLMLAAGVIGLRLFGTSYPPQLPTHADDRAPPPPSRLPAPSGLEPGHVGVILSPNMADIEALQAGLLVSVSVRLGDRVKSGTLLANLDDASVRSEQLEAEATAHVAEADAEQASLEAAHLHELVVRLQDSNKSYPEAYPDMVIKDAESKEKLAIARLASTKAVVAAREARAQATRLACDRTKIVAPFDGTVAIRYLNPGSTVHPGTPILRLVGSEKAFVRFAVPVNEAGKLRIGQPMRVAAETLPPLQASVSQISPEVDAASRMVVAEAKLLLVDASLSTTWIGRQVQISSLQLQISPAPSGAPAKNWLHSGQNPPHTSPIRAN